MRIVLVVLVVIAALLTAATGDASAVVANTIAGLVMVVLPFAIKQIRQRYPLIDGRVFGFGTFALAAVVAGIAVAITGEWKGIDTTSVETLLATAGWLWALQQGVYVLFKPALQVSNTR